MLENLVRPYSPRKRCASPGYGMGRNKQKYTPQIQSERERSLSPCALFPTSHTSGRHLTAPPAENNGKNSLSESLSNHQLQGLYYLIFFLVFEEIIVQCL